jgi:hypothetical protein
MMSTCEIGASSVAPRTQPGQRTKYGTRRSVSYI